ncbi:MAG TPA: hemagglutinin repeat-containing protein, partial [Rhodocyclaceae bacterium]|nr:hemagglutinin repeat-containing protein [Rhodocyclaceae bacterium]
SIQAATGALTLNAGDVDNTGGLIAAQQNTTIGTAVLNNSGGDLRSGGKLTLSATGTVTNAGGRIASAADLTLSASTLDNTSGRMGAIGGNLTIETTSSPLNNASGHLEAAGLARVSVKGFNNQGGLLTASSIELDTDGHALDNTSGRLIASGRGDVDRFDIRSGPLDNRGGLIQAGRRLRVDTGAYGLSNVATQISGGLVSQGTLDILSAAVDNGAGFIGAQGAMTLLAGMFANTQGGQVIGGDRIALSATTLDNRGGIVQGVGDVTLHLADLLDNRNSLIRAGGTLAFSADRLLNSDTQNAALGLEGSAIRGEVRLIDNTGGAIRATGDLSLSSHGHILNIGGSMSAGGTLSLHDPAAVRSLTVTQTGGTLLAGRLLDIDADSLGGDGELLSNGDLRIRVQQDYTHTGHLQAVGDARLETAGVLVNRAAPVAGGTLSLQGASVDNQAGAILNAGRLELRATDSHTFTNRGLIDSSETFIDAITLNNLGTGRIYGDHLAITAVTLNNLAEGGTAPVLAARDRLDLGVGTLTNAEGALIFSAGDLALGGALDASRRATGQGTALVNSSATVEALGNMDLRVARLDNLNAHYTTVLETVSQTHVEEYQGKDAIKRYLPGSPDVYIYNDESDYLHTPDGNYEEWSIYSYDRTVREERLLTSAPARIVAGGRITLTSDRVLNDRSQILAGGLLDGTIGTLSNVSGIGQRIFSDIGTVTNKWREHPSGRDYTGSATHDYAPPDTVEGIDLVPAAFQSLAATTETGLSLDPAKVQVSNSSIQTAGTVRPGSLTQADVIRDTAIDPLSARAADRADAIAAGPDAIVPSGRPPAATPGLSVTSAPSSALSPVSGAPGGDHAAALSIPTAASAQIPPPAGGEATPPSVVASPTGDHGTFPALPAGRPIDGLTGATANPIASPSAERWTPGPQDIPTAHAEVSTRSAQARPADPLPAPSATHSPAPRPRSVTPILQVAATTASGTASVVRSGGVDVAIPSNSLFRAHPEVNGRYLVETDPAFTRYEAWLGSDYLLQALAMDPATTQKRLGDGFYEQKLIRDQVAQLTGRRFLDGYASDEAEYRALMDAGLTVAKDWNLRPGVALSAAQMALLTRDMVWLVEQSVQLPDGSIQKVLVPQVYVRVRDGDLSASGALVAGRDVQLDVRGELMNQGTISAQGTARLSADTLRNLNGHIVGGDLTLQATGDLLNRGGELRGDTRLSVAAGRDLIVESTTRSQDNDQGSRTHIDHLASLSVTGPNGALTALAGRDLTLSGATVQSAGSVTLAAGNTVNLGTVGESSAHRIVWDANNWRTDRSTREVGTTVGAQGKVQMLAGQDIALRAATVTSQNGAIALSAGRDVQILAGQSLDQVDAAHQHTSRGFLSSKTITTRDQVNLLGVQGSTLSANTVTVEAGRNVQITGGQLVSDQGTRIAAAGDLNIDAATETRGERHLAATRSSGLLRSGLGVTLGSRELSVDGLTDSTRAVASVVGSTAGSLQIQAGKALRLAGSDLQAPSGDIALQAPRIDIAEARETLHTQTETRFRQSGITVAVSTPALTALQTAQQMNRAASQTADPRMKALAAASTALSAYSAGQAIVAGQGVTLPDGRTGQIVTGKDATGEPISRDATTADRIGGINITVSAGSSRSVSTQVVDSDTGRSSLVQAGRGVAITARGGANDGTLNIRGSTLSAGTTLTLDADNTLKLLAAQNRTTQTSANQSTSGSLGVTAGSGGVGVTLSASSGRGHSDGTDLSQLNTHLQAGQDIDLRSGGDTT